MQRVPNFPDLFLLNIITEAKVWNQNQTKLMIMFILMRKAKDDIDVLPLCGGWDNVPFEPKTFTVTFQWPSGHPMMIRMKRRIILRWSPPPIILLCIQDKRHIGVPEEEEKSWSVLTFFSSRRTYGRLSFQYTGWQSCILLSWFRSWHQIAWQIYMMMKDDANERNMSDQNNRWLSYPPWWLSYPLTRGLLPLNQIKFDAMSNHLRSNILDTTVSKVRKFHFCPRQREGAQN